MSGRPVRRRFLAEVTHEGGWTAILERIANGETIAAIARPFNVSRSFFARLLHEDRDRHELVRQARKAAAETVTEETVDSANSTRNEREQANRHSEFRTWLASQAARERYRAKQPPKAEINIGQLHLDTLRARAAAPPPATASRPAPTVEVVLSAHPEIGNGGGA